MNKNRLAAIIGSAALTAAMFTGLWSFEGEDIQREAVARAREGGSSSSSYSASQAATDTGWYSDGGSTATTLRAAVGAGGISTDGGIALPLNGSFCLNLGTCTARLTNNGTEVLIGDPNNSAFFGVNYSTGVSRVSGGLTILAGTFTVTVGPIVVGQTDSSGTPGAATINKPSGRSAVALGAASVTITNSQATAASRIFISPTGRDATCLLPVVTTRSAGSFVVTTVGNCTAALSFDWLVIQ